MGGRGVTTQVGYRAEQKDTTYTVVSVVEWAALSDTDDRHGGCSSNGRTKEGVNANLGRALNNGDC